MPFTFGAALLSDRPPTAEVEIYEGDFLAAKIRFGLGDGMHERLKHVLDAHHLLCGAVISASGVIVARVGDFAAFKSDGLVSALLGPYGDVKATFDSLVDQILPRIWAQGSEFAFVDKPSAEIAVVVFGRGNEDALTQYELSKAVGRSIAEAFAA